MTGSSRFVVAVHILVLLAYGQGRAMSSELIAGSVNTNPVVIRRILRLLARAGLVVTVEGVGGGARLARPAGEIELAEVYGAVEPGAMFPLHRQPPRATCPVGGNIQAALGPTLDAAAGSLLATLARTTVADVLQRLEPAPDA